MCRAGSCDNLNRDFEKTVARISMQQIQNVTKDSTCKTSGTSSKIIESLRHTYGHGTNSVWGLGQLNRPTFGTNVKAKLNFSRGMFAQLATLVQKNKNIFLFTRFFIVSSSYFLFRCLLTLIVYLYSWTKVYDTKQKYKKGKLQTFCCCFFASTCYFKESERTTWVLSAELRTKFPMSLSLHEDCWYILILSWVEKTPIDKHIFILEALYAHTESS